MTGLSAATERVREWLSEANPEVAVVLGSGLGALANSVRKAKKLAYREVPGFPVPKVAGHGGELVAGDLEGKQVVVQSGRFHLYEGHEPETVALPMRVFAELGIGMVIVTNAAGGIRPGFRPPALMVIADQINLMWRNPIIGPVGKGEERFPDMSEPYDRALRALAREVAVAEGVELEEGVYAGLLGPTYETPAEVRMLRHIGADAVGMSTVPEVIVARTRGMRVLGLSTITNLAAGISPTSLSHQEVLEAGKRVAERLERLVRGVIRRL